VLALLLSPARSQPQNKEHIMLDTTFIPVEESVVPGCRRCGMHRLEVIAAIQDVGRLARAAQRTQYKNSTKFAQLVAMIAAARERVVGKRAAMQTHFTDCHV
jgi:hypothetical protein